MAMIADHLVARMKRSAIRVNLCVLVRSGLHCADVGPCRRFAPDFASLHPGYGGIHPILCGSCVPLRFRKRLAACSPDEAQRNPGQSPRSRPVGTVFAPMLDRVAGLSRISLRFIRATEIQAVSKSRSAHTGT